MTVLAIVTYVCGVKDYNTLFKKNVPDLIKINLQEFTFHPIRKKDLIFWKGSQIYISLIMKI